MMMNFKELLIGAKRGEQCAKEKLLKMYEGLLVREAIVEGIFNEDLYQELCYRFIRCVEIFKI